jgi:hypothetical protein
MNVDYTAVPEGTYRCRVAEVRPGTTRAGDERWSLRLETPDGKLAAWDSIVFSIRGRIRARMVLTAFGLPATGRVSIEPKDLEGREAMVSVRPATYTSASGDTVTRNEVPYDGYAIAQGHGQSNP